MEKLSFTFLGTCAADFSLKLQAEYKDKFDLDARRASCALIGTRYMVDCGPHALDSLRIAGIDGAQITDIFFTHLHDDHFNAENVEKLAKGRKTPLRVWVREDAALPVMGNVEVLRMKDRTVYEFNGGKVTGLRANHAQETAPQFLLFEIAGKKILYATDGAWFLNTTYYYLKEAKLDLLAIDCTTGDYAGDFRAGEHNGIPMLRVLLPSLKTWGTIDGKTKVYFTHLAPSLHAPHVQTEKIAAEMGARVAYDGLKVEL